MNQDTNAWLAPSPWFGQLTAEQVALWQAGMDWTLNAGSTFMPFCSAIRG
jgi:hypothetical protein